MSFYPKMHGGLAAGIYIARTFHHQVNDRKMKLFFMRVMTLAFLLTLNCVLLAAGTSGQDLSQTRLSIDLRDVSLKTALKRIEGSTSYSFSFRTADISSAGRVSLSAKDISLEKLLSELFSSAGLSYEVINSNIIIKKNRPSIGVESENILDNGGIKGRVVDDKGQAVVNASVLIMETKIGTAADDNGRFSFTGIAPGTYRLQISAIGYLTLTKSVVVSSNQITDANMALQADATTNMTEITVTALGIKKERRELGYSAQEVKGDALVASHQSNIVNALQGQATGLQINSGGGAPGQGAKILLRGINSLDPNRDFQPLFVIDGVPIDNATSTDDGSELLSVGNRASDINPDDIESVNILKGGAATALYGLRAATGAIIITTKSGKAGKLRVQCTSTGSIDEINKYPETQGVYTQGNLGVYDSSSFWPGFGPTIAEAKAIDPTHPDKLFNNFKHGYKQGKSIRNSLNISGGNERATFTAAFSQFNQDGIMPFTDYRNYSAKVGGDFKISEKLRFGTSLNYIKSGGRRQNADRYNENLTYFAPRWDIWDYIKPDGSQKTIVGSDNWNPIYILYGTHYVDDVDRIISNSNITYSPFKWLDVSYRFGIDHYNDSRILTKPGPLGVPDELYSLGDFENGVMNVYNATNTVLNSTFMLNFKNSLGTHLKSSLKIGHDLYKTKKNYQYTDGDTLIVPTFYSLSNVKRTTGRSYTRDYRIIGLFADWTLSWDNFLYLTLTGRNDITSTLRKENRSFFYPSASISYVFSENFNLPSWMTFGKVRFSVAGIGKDAVPYATAKGFQIGSPLTNNVSPFNLSDQIGDTNLIAEFTTSYEAGFELRFLQNRLGLDFTYYNNTSKDLLIPVKVPVTSGYDQIYLNSGSIRNKGLEISVSGTPVQTKDFSWDIRVNYTKNVNKVLSIYPDLKEITMGSQFGYSSSTVTQKYIPGYPVGALFGRNYERYYGDKEENPEVLEKDLPIVIGANGFPVLNPASKQQYIANSQPKWIGSFSSTLRYKNFNLYFLFDAQQGVYRFNQFANFLASFALQKDAEHRNDIVVFPGVLEDGTPNTKPVWLGQGTGPDGVDYGSAGYYRAYYRAASENFVEDASWVRLRTLSLGYSVPVALVQKTKILQGASITFSGNNLWLSTKYSTFDPESSSTNSGSVSDGFAGFTYPATRNYILSVNLNF